MLQRQQVAAGGGRHRRALAAAATATTATTTTTTTARRRRARAASSSAAAAAVAEPATAVVVRPLSGEAELWAVARLRAEAYHEDDTSRFAGTFKKQFAEREAASLRQRIAGGGAPGGGGGGGPLPCECLVAVEPPSVAGDGEEEEDDDEGDEQHAASASASSAPRVLGCIDLRPPRGEGAAPATPSLGAGVPPEDAAHGAYLLNVVVAEGARGRGVGQQLMRAAMRRAREAHGARRAYTHVEAANGAAARLYGRCGFQQSGEESGALSGALDLGRILLLRADLETDSEGCV